MESDSKAQTLPNQPQVETALGRSAGGLTILGSPDVTMEARQTTEPSAFTAQTWEPPQLHGDGNSGSLPMADLHCAV